MLPKIGILCAGDEELAPFLPLLDRRSVRRQAMLTIHEGWIASVPAAACFEENCRRASEIAAQVTHALFKRLAVSESCPSGSHHQCGHSRRHRPIHLHL